MPDRLLIFDTATTGRWRFNVSDDSSIQPHLVRLAYLVTDNGEMMLDESQLIRPLDGWFYEPGAIAQHGVTPELATERGISPAEAWSQFSSQMAQADLIVAFNTDFHLRVIERTCQEVTGQPLRALNAKIECAMRVATPFVRKPRGGTHGYAWPKMWEAYEFFTGNPLPKTLDPIDQGHLQTNATLDIWRGIVDAMQHA